MPANVPMHRYWNGHSNDHFYTADDHEIGTVNPKHGYTYEGVVGYL